MQFASAFLAACPETPPGVARGLKLRHDHGSNYMSGDFQDEIECLGIANDAGFADFAGDEDVLSQIFGREGRGNIRMRGTDAHYRLALDFLDAINGGKQQITLPDGSVLDVNISPGTRDGQTLRLRGKGRPGIGGGAPGDALVEV
jgi:DnaJ-class molecular chaperone